MSAGEDWSDAMGFHCATCRYWSDKEGVAIGLPNEGACRKRAPMFVPALAEEIAGTGDHSFDDMIALSTVYPITKDYDWCGEYASADIHPTADVLPTRITTTEGDGGTGKSFLTASMLDRPKL